MSIKKGLSYAILAAALGLSSCVSIQRTENDYEDLIRKIKTPQQARDYCDTLRPQKDFHNYGKDDYWASFKVINERKKDDGDGAAIAAAVLLSDNGYPAKVLIAYTPNKWTDAVFLYEKEGKYGSIGIHHGDCHGAKYDTIGDLVKAINKSLWKDFEAYCVLDFSDSYYLITYSDENLSWLYEKKSKKAKRFDLNNKEISQ